MTEKTQIFSAFERPFEDQDTQPMAVAPPFVSAGPAPEDNEAQVETLEALSRQVLAALERYEAAVRRVDDLSLVDEVCRIRAEHAETLARIRAATLDKGGRLQKRSGAWAMVNAWTSRAAATFGDGALLRVLRSHETVDLKNLERVLDDTELDDDVISLLRHRMIPEQHRHLDALDRLAEQRVS